MWSNVAYFFTWRSRGYRVSKTRFITLINIEKNLEHIREEPREKKKKKPETKREEPRTSEKPKQRAAQVVRSPGSMPPRLRVAHAVHDLGCSRVTQAVCGPGRARPGSRAAQAAHGPGRVRPRLRTAWVFFHPGRLLIIQ